MVDSDSKSFCQWAPKLGVHPPPFYRQNVYSSTFLPFTTKRTEFYATPVMCIGKCISVRPGSFVEVKVSQNPKRYNDIALVKAFKEPTLLEASKVGENRSMPDVIVQVDWYAYPALRRFCVWTLHL